MPFPARERIQPNVPLIAAIALSFAVFGLGPLLFGAPASSQQPDPQEENSDGASPITTQAGVYSDEQADKGEKLFGEVCMVCHQPEEFSEGGYMDGWAGQDVGDMFDLIRATMPEDSPGRLKREEYADILAYLFRLNGLPSGEKALAVKRLKGIVIEGPFGEAGS